MLGRTRRQRREAWEFYLLVAPWVIGFLWLTAGPMLYSLYLSATNYDLFHPPQWVGLGNFRFLLTAPHPASLFWRSAAVTLYYTIVTVPLGLSGSLLLALMLNARIRGVSLYRTLFYLPTLTPSVANALLWVWIFNSRFGLANTLLRNLSLPTQRWLTDPQLVIPSFVLMDMWGVGGNTAVIFLAGLQGVGAHLYEAAEIDGAGWWQRFWRVTVPQISPVVFFNLLLGFIGTFQVFGTAFLMTDGGPNYASYFIGYYIYQEAFRSLRMGRGAALAWILFVVLMVFTLTQFVLSRRWVYYEGEVRG
jgi:multiple sugar transport system permease protein